MEADSVYPDKDLYKEEEDDLYLKKGDEANFFRIGGGQGTP